MSMISHRCSKCGHLDIHGHNARGEHIPCSQGNCRVCTNGRHCDYGVPELVDTFDLKGNVQQDIIQPGQGHFQGIRPCGCADCRGLYESLATARAS